MKILMILITYTLWKKYNLTTICDETFVKDEYLKMMR